MRNMTQLVLGLFLLAGATRAAAQLSIEITGPGVRRPPTGAVPLPGGKKVGTRIASTVGAAVSWTTRFKQRNNRLPRDPIADHVALRHAIASRDPAFARQTTHELLRMALEDMARTGSRRTRADKA